MKFLGNKSPRQQLWPSSSQKLRGELSQQAMSLTPLKSLRENRSEPSSTELLSMYLPHSARRLQNEVCCKIRQQHAASMSMAVSKKIIASEPWPQTNVPFSRLGCRPGGPSVVGCWCFLLGVDRREVYTLGSWSSLGP